MTQATSTPGGPAAPGPDPLPHTASAWIEVAPLAELEQRGGITVSGPRGRIAVFAHDGRIDAVDNRCPHMGFPLDRGSVADGILTCHWHEARFDLASGCTFDLFADDVARYETHVDDGTVFVASLPIRIPDAPYFRRRLQTGVEQNVPLVQAKSLLGLLDADADIATIVRDVALYASRNQASFGEGLVRLTCVANLHPELRQETAYQALLYAIRQVAAETVASIPRRDREPLDTDRHDPATLARWLGQWIRTRHRDATERTLLTGIRSGEGEPFSALLLGAASERLYATTGHVLDACNKAMELIDLLGWETAAEIVPLLVPALTQSRGEEEATSWHHPIEIADPVRAVEARLPGLLAPERNPDWSQGPAITKALLGNDPIAIVDGLAQALGDGAPPEALARRIAHAASLRLARFATSNEVTDWFEPQHTLNFANAVHRAVERSTAPGVVRAIFSAAIAVYTTRYLNVPAAKLPSERGSLSDLPVEAASLREALLEILDQRAEIDAAARLVSRHLEQGHAVGDLVDTLAYAAVREDIDFHCLQVVEASARQSAAWSASGDDEAPAAIEAIWVGAVRNLAAHCPTRRAGQQTANIALRLHRGEHVFEEDD